MRKLLQRSFLSLAATAAFIVGAGNANAETLYFQYFDNVGDSATVKVVGNLDLATNVLLATSGSLTFSTINSRGDGFVNVGQPYDLIELSQMTPAGGQFYADNPYQYADNLIYLNHNASFGTTLSSYLTGFGGLNFGTIGGLQFHIQANGDYGYALLGTPGTGYFWNPANVDSPGYFVPVASPALLPSVPEPSSFALLGLGGLGLAFCACRKRFAAV